MQVQTQKQIKILQTEAKNVANKLNKKQVRTVRCHVFVC